MEYNGWFKRNTSSLEGKTVVLTGAAGGLGTQCCFHLARLGADIVAIDRNIEGLEKLKSALLEKHANLNVEIIEADLSNMADVQKCVEKLKKLLRIDILVHNAGVFRLPVEHEKGDYNIIFKVNFIAPYYMTKKLLPLLEKSEKAKVIVVSSIAHTYARYDEKDIDYSNNKDDQKIYGNSKRFIMYSLMELLKNNNKVDLSIVHPGISYTNIMKNFPKFISKIIEVPMKLIFNSPKKSSLSIIKGIFGEHGYCEWFGPKLFDIWGLPNCKKLKSCSQEERNKIFNKAEEIYIQNLKKMAS